MALPINIPELLSGKVVEWDRLEFKKGWNPEAILHTICAFANDMNNWGGGYVIVGIDADQGIPKQPISGLPLHTIDAMQGKLLEICHMIQPAYLPISQPYSVQGKHVFVIWVPAGDLRPYSCPSTFGKDSRRQYYVRNGSNTIVAQQATFTRLMQLAARIPFDDRPHHEAQLSDLDFGLMREFLARIKSDLFEASSRMPHDELCRQMQVARGPVEYLRPINAGLLFFNREPHRFFQRAWIHLAIHQDEKGRSFVSEIFKGPIHYQIEQCLNYLKAHVLRTQTLKIAGQAEAEVVENWPFEVVEEVLVNAVYHKSYEEGKPIEIQVFPDRIEFLSFPGPPPPLRNADLSKNRIIARDYRNRRIGDMLRELKLTEGMGTGMPLVHHRMKANGSPAATFYTDEDCTLFLATLPCNPNLIFTKIRERLSMGILQEIVSRMGNAGDLDILADLLRTERISELDGVGKSKNTGWGTRIARLLSLLQGGDRGRMSLFEAIELNNETRNFHAYLRPLIEVGWVEMTIPDKPNSRNQKYRLSAYLREELQLE